MDRLTTISAWIGIHMHLYIHIYVENIEQRIMHMTHRMMNVALMTSNDDIESSSSVTTKKENNQRKTEHSRNS